MINDFFSTYYTINRLVWSTDSDGLQSSALEQSGSFFGHIQQATPQLAQNLALNLTKTFTIWCEVDTDVREGDQIENEAGEVYVVRAIQKNNYGTNQHLELVVEYDHLEETSS